MADYGNFPHTLIICNTFLVHGECYPGSTSGMWPISWWSLMHTTCHPNKPFNSLLIKALQEKPVQAKFMSGNTLPLPQPTKKPLNVSELSHYNSKHVKSNLINFCRDTARKIQRACSKCSHQFIYVCSELNSVPEAMWCSLMKHKELRLMQYPQSLSEKMLRIIIHLCDCQNEVTLFSSSCLPMEINVDKVNISCIHSADSFDINIHISCSN